MHTPVRALLLGLALTGCQAADPAADAQVDALPTAQAAAPGDLTLSSTPLVVGAPVTISFSGANPNTRTYLFRSASESPGGFCPGAIAPDCLDLAPPVTIQFDTFSDAAGEGSISFTFPSVPPAVSQVAMQVGYIASPTIDTSNTILETIHQANSDLDGDNLTAIDEVTLYGTDPDLADSDGGGENDDVEIANGTDPLDPGDDIPVTGALPIDDALPGDLIITEIFQNPDFATDGDGEWFEIHNTTTDDFDLDGMIFRDAGTNTKMVSGTVIIPAGGYSVFAINGDPVLNGGITPDYVWTSGFTLSNSDDEVILENASGVIDEVYYDGGPVFPDPTGASMNLDPAAFSAAGNDNGISWCESTGAMPTPNTDFGTPGAANTPCPPVPTFTNDILPLFQATCTNCHTNGGANAGFAADDYASVTALSTQVPTMARVDNVGGRWTSSYLWYKINGTQATAGGTGNAMPLGGSLSPAQIDLIETWIDRGAPEN